MYAIGIDSGTQGTKALVVDFDRGRVLGRGYAPHLMVPGLPPGASEQDPRTWVRAMEAALAAALKESKVDPKKIVSLGISGQQHGFVPLDGKGRPIRPAKLWNDTSTIEETGFLVGRLGGPKEFIRKLGINLAVGFTASKILWLKNHEPANFKKLATVLLPHNYLNYHLTGRAHMEYGDASGTGLMDIRNLRWSEEAAQAIDPGLSEKLPALSHPKEPAGFVRKALAAKFGLGKVLVSAGGGDNMMGAIGTGNVTPGVVTASFGTSGTIYAYASKPVVDPQGEIAAFCSSTGGWLPLLCTMNVTTVTEQVRAIFGYDHAALDAAVAAAPAGADGLVLLPYLEGERTPNVPEGSGVWLGLNKKTLQAGHLARAAMEGATMGMNYGLRRLADLGMKAKEIRVTGGGARSPVWRQLMADIFGVPVVAMVEDEGAALGGALQAAWCTALLDGEKAKLPAFTGGVVALNESTRCLPDKTLVARYRELQALQDKLSLALRPVFPAQRKLAGS